MNPRSLCHSATELSDSEQLKQLALLSVGVIAAANLLNVLVELLISSMMSDAIGLSALGKRSMLLTIQNFLQFAISLALPFWGYGFYRVAIQAARRESADQKTLLWGFCRFAPLLRLMAIEFLIAMGYVMLACFGASTLFMMTPWAEQAFNNITPYLAEAEALANNPEALNALMEPVMANLIKNLWPMYLLIAVALGVLLIPWLYKLRLAPFHILDGENSALAAMAKSQQEMHGNKFAFFRLDLCWWWYYGLLLLASVPLYMTADYGTDQLQFWGLMLLGLGLQALVQWQLMPRVQISYALAYDQLTKKDEQ